jgi:hypothetical protein
MIINVAMKGGNKLSKTKCEHPERKPAHGECSKELQEKCHGKSKEQKCEEK